MSKINLLSIILITSLLSACGFHTPYKNTPLNASITSTDNNAFTLELRKRFNSEATQSLAIQVGDEVQKKQTSSYDSSGKTSSYTLSLSVPVKVFNNNNKLLLSQNLTASTHLSKMSASYEQLRNTIIKKLLRRLNRLNEN